MNERINMKTQVETRRELIEMIMIYLKDTKEELTKFGSCIGYLAAKIANLEDYMILLDERIKKNEEYLEIERLKKMYWRS
jgi:hypothetical protein